MPRRLLPLITYNYYHCFNRGVNKQQIFLNKRDYTRALDTLRFYIFRDPPIKYSKLFFLNTEDRIVLLDNLRKNNQKLVNIICFAFMPNHFHFLIEQISDNGISKFMSNFQNSYSRYFNVKHERVGPLFQGQFKAVRIEDTEQLLHVSRYIHLNPYTSGITKDKDDLEKYIWSSYSEYSGVALSSLCDKEVILSQFSHSYSYREFVSDNADYQKKLGEIKHLMFE